MENLKICIIGDAGTGKTQLLRTLCDDKIKEEEYGQNIAYTEVDVENETYQITLWDLPAQKRFSALRTSYYKGSAVIVIVFDMTRRSSFTELSKWVREVADSLKYIPKLAFFGAKKDLSDFQEIDEEEIKRISEKFNIEYFILSMNSKEDITNALSEVLKKLKEK